MVSYSAAWPGAPLGLFALRFRLLPATPLAPVAHVLVEIGVWVLHGCRFDVAGDERYQEDRKNSERNADQDGDANHLDTPLAAARNRNPKASSKRIRSLSPQRVNIRLPRCAKRINPPIEGILPAPQT